MNDLETAHWLLPSIPPMDKAQIDRVTDLSAIDGIKPQVSMPVRHFIHGGMYARTITIPPSVRITGALIKVETILIVSGNCTVCIGDDVAEIDGYHVFACAAPRKQAFVARTPTDLTMLFPTSEIDVKKAEEQFTDEWRLLTTRTNEV